MSPGWRPSSGPRSAVQGPAARVRRWWPVPSTAAHHDALVEHRAQHAGTCARGLFDRVDDLRKVGAALRHRVLQLASLGDNHGLLAQSLEEEPVMRHECEPAANLPCVFSSGFTLANRWYFAPAPMFRCWDRVVRSVAPLLAWERPLSLAARRAFRRADSIVSLLRRPFEGSVVFGGRVRGTHAQSIRRAPVAAPGSRRLCPAARCRCRISATARRKGSPAGIRMPRSLSRSPTTTS